jgi:hypothetical protein
MNLIRALSIVLAGLLAFSVQAGTINTITVDDASDYNFGQWPGDGNDQTKCTLRKAIANANNAAQTYTDCKAGAADGNLINFSVNGPIVIGSMGGPIFINRSLTISGAVTIDGNQQGEIFRVNSSGVELDLIGLTLKNGSNGAVSINSANSKLSASFCAFHDNAHPGGGGGAITSSGRITILGCDFQDNAANGSGGGGAIRLSSSDPSTITGSNFINNSAKTSGGAIHYSSSGNLASLTISLSNFINNSAKAEGGSNEGGGAIWHQSGLLTVVESLFTHNQVKGDEGRGGALHLANGAPMAVIEHNLFVMNKAKGNKGMGGAIFTARAALANGNSFLGNSADDEGMGGAIANLARVKVNLVDSAAGFLVSNSTFNDNSADLGGAIYNSGPETGTIDRGITLINVTMAGNSASTAGGGIYNHEGNRKPEADVRNTIIANNTANNSPNNCASSNGDIPILNKGGNLLWSGACPADSALPEGNPKLDAPQIAGLPTVWTMAPQAGSAALQTADAQTCANFPIFNMDQRLATRPNPEGTVCDVGAHESSLGPPAPGLAITPASGLAFGSVPEGSIVSLPATISNPGTLPMSGLQLSVSGSGGHFSLAAGSDCGSGLAPGASCQAQVQFLAPLLKEAASGQLVATGDGDLQASLALSGSGFVVVEDLDLLPTSGLAFGDVPVGDVSTAVDVTVHNTGTVELTGLDFSLESPFYPDAGGTCGSSLAAQQTCVFPLYFAPELAGLANGNLLVTTNQGPNGGIVLSGFGTAPASLGLSSRGLNFGDQEVGEVSNIRIATLTNHGTETATGIGWTSQANLAPYAIVFTNCSSELKGGQSCIFELVFAPVATGLISLDLAISSDLPRNPVVTLSGTGFIPPKLRLEATNGDDFGPVLTGTTSAAKAMTIHNDGGQPLENLTWGVSAPFGLDAIGCLDDLDPGSSCSIWVDVSPYQDGEVIGSFSVSAQGGLNDQLGLQATGYTPGDVVIQPATGLAFGSVPVGSTSPSQSFTVGNPGSRDIWLTALNPPAEVQIESHDCPIFGPAVFAGGASCTIKLAYAPGSAGTLSDTFEIQAFHPPGAIPLTRTAPLSGEAYVQGSQLRFEPVDGLDFGPVAVGTTSPSLMATLKNISATEASISLTFPPGGEFAVDSGDCGSTLAANSECTIALQFSPGNVGAKVDKITATSGGGAEQLTLRGQGFDASQPVLATNPAYPGPLSFSARPGQSDVRQVQISNLGDALLGIGQPGLSGAHAGDFMVLTPLPMTLESGQSATLQIACIPNGGGYRTALLNLASTDPDQLSFSFSLSCVGIVPLFSDRFAAEIVH